MQVEEFLELSARRFPDKTALVCGDPRLNYWEIEEQCNRLAHALIGEGVQRGDRVAVYLENSVEAVVSVFAILKAGAVFLVINGIKGRWAQTPHVKSIFVAGKDEADSGKPFIPLGNVLHQSDLPNHPPART